MDKPVDFDTKCRRQSVLAKAWDDFWGKNRRGDKVWVGLPAAIDRVTRHVDRFFSRSYNGVFQRLFMNGHSLVPTLLMLIAIPFSVLGPTPRFRGWLAVSGVFAAVAIYWLFVRYVLARRADGRGLLSFQFALLGVLAAVYAFGLPTDIASEALPAPYRNLFAPVTLLLLALAIVSGAVACWVMHDFPDADRHHFAELLTETELFVWPRPGESSLQRSLHGFINAPLYHPLHLLLMPALPLIAVPAEYVTLAGGFLLATAWLLLTFAGMYDRLSLMIKVVRQFFLIGGQLVVSLVIIGLAVARVCKIDYVTTILDSATAITILCYVLAAYTAFWLYEYWINRALTERMLPLMQPARQAPERASCIPYRIKTNAVSTKVAAEDRAVEVFSGGRFAVSGGYWDQKSQTNCAAWTPYEKTELFDRLAQSARELKNWDTEKAYQCNIAAAEITRRTKLYFNLMNLLLVGSLAAAGFSLYQIPERPQAIGYRIDADTTAEQPVSLKQLVFDRRRTSNKVILLAASGGGTRAALFTASVLRGIAELGRLDDLVLVSGVSGGSAALAYFAVHHDELRRRVPGPCTAVELERADNGDESGVDAWCAYVAAMAKPYIEDVLRGASEVDIAMSKSFGHLLNESFLRSFGVNPKAPVSLSNIDGLGVILNTTLSGHPASDSAWLDSLYHDNSETGPRSYSVSAGGRLIFTNLQDVRAFPKPEDTLAHAEDEYFRYVIVGGKRTSLTAAAALSANFPPVFSNGGVVVLDGPFDSVGQRYWVTDGGAADNRGIISLLYAVHSMLDKCREQGECQAAPPEIHIIVADASAVTIDYHSDRGSGSIHGAANKFASQLMLELIVGAQQKYSRLGQAKLVTHYLPLPAVLRMRGGLGTHWMMPRTVTLKDICHPNGKSAATLDVQRLPLMQMIVDMHTLRQRPLSRKDKDCQAPRGDNPGAWLAADRHSRAWSEIVTALTAP